MHSALHGYPSFRQEAETHYHLTAIARLNLQWTGYGVTEISAVCGSTPFKWPPLDCAMVNLNLQCLFVKHRGRA